MTEEKIIKSIGKEMLDLIEDTQQRFDEKYGFKPSIIDITNMIARAVKKKGGIVIN